MFSRISAKLHGAPNALYELRDSLKDQGHIIHDFISGNLTDHGFTFPQSILEEILLRAARRCQVYRPDSFGQPSARAAVSQYYQESGLDIKADAILLTPGTSLSYWYCFRLLADEGDEILCPCPSYPLFDYIALLSGVKLAYYRHDEKRNWNIDIEQLEAQISTKTRALILISPHNPTGHVASKAEIKALADVARRHQISIISDEVFSEFLLEPVALPRAVESSAPLIFTLNGFSKMFGLPGVKFGWMAVSGDSDKVAYALRALELISDTFLPVNEIIQAAAPEIFSYGRALRTEFARRLRRCWECIEAILSSSPYFTYVKPQGGFYVTLHLADGIDEELAARAILEHKHLLVHPGYFYDMEPDHLVMSFIQDPDKTRALLPGLVSTLAEIAHCGTSQSDPHRNLNGSS